MQEYETFIFEKYEFDRDRREIRLVYSLDGEVGFTETIFLPEREYANYDAGQLDKALFALHLIGGASYYKTCLPKTIAVQSGALTSRQAEFWNTVYTKGLGEFFYKNQIDFRGLVNFPADSTEPDPHRAFPSGAPQRPLTPFGGGKDSLATLELLKQQGASPTLFRMGSHPIIENLTALTGQPLLTVERRLAPELFELNKDGALNGHVPITTYVSFLATVTSLLYGFDAVYMSNERSASAGNNAAYFGLDVNHQWSKSQEAEELIREYIATHITDRIQYLNPLRWWSELSITREVVKHPEYLPALTSCNENWKQAHPEAGNLWCGKCPKCAFSFALLSAFLPLSELTGIFGKNLFDDANLLPLYRELLGLEQFKPFECVGTPEETAAALWISTQKPEYADTEVGRLFLREVAPTLTDPERLLTELYENH